MDGLPLHELPSNDGHEAPLCALVIILFAAGKGAEQAQAFARLWQPSVPHAAFGELRMQHLQGKHGIYQLVYDPHASQI